MKLIKYFALTILLHCSISCIAQQQINWNWYFGHGAALNFSSGSPVAVAGSAISTTEGCASISDPSGNLLFYTDGINVWNRLNVPMPNGNGLYGNPSSTESGIIVPKPGSSNLYYVFTSDCAGGHGINYYEVDMNLNSGNGDVISNVATPLLANATEKLTAIRNCNSNDFWVIAHQGNTDSFYVWPVTSSGVGNPVVSAAGSVYTGTLGYLKASPDGRKLAAALFEVNFVDLLDFSAQTGIVSNTNAILLPVPNEYAYGLSFSPNSQVLYEVGDAGAPQLIQFDLSSNNQSTIISSVYNVATLTSSGGAIQVGPDGKMYVCNYASSYLDVINNPDVLGSGCNFVFNAVPLIGGCQIGLPNTIDALTAPFPATSENVAIVSCTDSLILSPTGPGTSYLWSTGATTETITVHTANTYWVHVIGATSCNQTINIADTFQVTFAQHPIVNLGPNHSVCGNGPDTLRAGNPGDTYHWSTGATTDSIYVNTTGTYHVSVSNGGCTTVDSVTVTFVNAPTVNLGPDTTICSNASITLNAGNTGFNFLWNNGATTQTITVNSAGIYSVYVSQSVCHGADTIHVYLANPPIVNIGPDSTICSNQSVTLNAGNTGSTFSWSTGATTQSIVANTSGIYWVHVSNLACSNNDSATITVIQMPIVNLGFDTTLCIGESITLNAGNTGYIYHWNTGATTQTLNVSTSGNYSVIVNQNLCVAKDTIVISFIPLPVVNLGNDTMVCSPNPVTLHAQNTGNRYLWSTGQTSQNISANTPGIYWVIVDNGSCTSADSITISVVNPPVLSPNFFADTTNGCNPLTINFTNNSNGATSYLWRYGDNTTTGSTFNVSHTYTDTGVFTVTLVLINDTSTVCGKYYDSLVIPYYIAIANPIHVTSDFLASPLSGCAPMTVNLTNKSLNAANYIWHFGNGTSITDTGNVQTIYHHEGKYTITLIASNYNTRCYNPPDSISIEVTVDSCNLYIPNVFSPNNDGLNDFYQLVAEGYSNYHLIIFDRWGLKVFESNNKDLYWNGMINNSGSKAPDGTYFYIFTAIDPDKKPFSNNGYLTLMR